MGTRATIVVTGGDGGLLDRAERRLAELEGRWSRFRADSEVSRLNAAAGRTLEVSADTALLVQRAREAWRLTDGAFDPLLLRALERLGYDRSFELVEAGRPASGVAPSPASSAPGRPTPSRPSPVKAIAIGDHTVQLPAGVAFDPGGIGKGLAADLVATELLARGARGALVEVGGDLRAIGRAPQSSGWGVEVEDHTGAAIGLLALVAGGVATTTSARRRWRQPAHGDDPGTRHHLVDPATGKSAAGPVRSVTVVAGEAWLAEVLATATFLRGPMSWLHEHGATGLVTVGDHVIALDGIEEYLR